MDKFTANLASSLRRFAMAGVGAISLTVDKSREIIDQLASRGEVSAAEGQAACDELHKRLTEQLSAFTQKLRTDYENLSFEQMLTRCEKLTPEQKLRLFEKLNEAPAPENQHDESPYSSDPDSKETSAEETAAESAPSAEPETADTPSNLCETDPLSQDASETGFAEA